MGKKPLKIGETTIRTIYDLIDLMRVRPGMWIGALSITRLNLYLEGFQTGVHATGASFEPESPPFQRLHAWVGKRVGRQGGGIGWCELLLDSCDGDEEAAFHRFWIELDLFRAQ